MFTKYSNQLIQFFTRSAAIVMALLCSATHGHAQKDSQQGIFYAVTHPGSKDTSWLFGTFHLVNSSYFNEHPAVTRAYNQSKGLIVEIVMDSGSAAAAQRMSLLENNKLSNLLEPTLADSLDAELKAATGSGIQQFEQLKPTAVMLTISIVHMMQNNQLQLSKFKGAPMDLYFATQAKQRNKSITPLETVEEQIRILFQNTSDAEQAKQLTSFMRNKQRMLQLSDELLLTWFSNDLAAMEKIYASTVAISGENDELVKNRNQRWMQQLPALLRRQSQFVAVGALHLAGNDGLVHQLQQQGFQVTPVKF